MKFIGSTFIALILVGCSTGAGNLKAVVNEMDTMPEPIYFAVGQVGINSAAGVDVGMQLVATTPGKTVRYVDFYVSMINAVGDPIESRIGSSKAKLEVVGPIEFGGTEEGFYKAIFYNGSSSCIKTDKVVVTFMDGTAETLEGKELREIQHQKADVGYAVDWANYRTEKMKQCL